MSDQIYLHGMEFEGRHGVTDEERSEAQSIELDVELSLDLRAAGQSDDLALTVDYGAVFEICRQQVEEHSYHLLEGLAEAVAADVLGRFSAVDGIVVRANKPGVPLDGVVEHAGVRIERSRS
ncbi:dihydroneopterin aldolase [soil metagenome]